MPEVGGTLITFEGCEGSGKTTQAQLLYERLVNTKSRVLLFHEPGNTALGEEVGKIVKSYEGLTSAAELALFVAARSQLIAEKIRPEIKQGSIVILDRFIDSTEAYQGYGRQLPLRIIRILNKLVTGGLVPQLTFLLDLESAEGLERIGRAHFTSEPDPLPEEPLVATQLGFLVRSVGRSDKRGQRRFEKEPLAFHQRVRQGYLAIARREPERVVVIDGALSREEISGLIWGKVAAQLGLQS